MTGESKEKSVCNYSDTSNYWAPLAEFDGKDNVEQYQLLKELTNNQNQTETCSQA
jgi:hypothetical protein